MSEIKEQLRQALTVERYPRSSTYDPQWLVDNLMGPHPLWLAESLSQVMPLQAGMRVLDLGCGTALTSIFLAKEFDVEVWAADLWVKPTDNWQRIQEAGVSDRVYPLGTEARELPFAEGFFDAIVSFDAFHYFGTDTLYLPYCLDFLVPGGPLGIVVPGMRLEPGQPLPPYLAEHWDPQRCAHLGPDWWRTHWERTGLVTVKVADMVPHGWEDWLRWLEACDLVGKGYAPDAEILRADRGAVFGFTRMLAHRT